MIEGGHRVCFTQLVHNTMRNYERLKMISFHEMIWKATNCIKLVMSKVTIGAMMIINLSILEQFL